MELSPRNFTGLLTSVTEEGLFPAIAAAIAKAFKESVEAQFGRALVKFKTDFSTNRHDVTVWSIINENGLQVVARDLTVDLERDAFPAITGVIFPDGVTEGYSDWNGKWISNLDTPRHKKMATRDRYFYRWLQFRASLSVFGFNFADVERCHCPTEYLYPRNRLERGLITWICACCGSTYFCACSRGVPDYILKKLDRNSKRQKFIELINSTQYRRGICHLCRNIPSTLIYRSEMYGSRVSSNYFPYINEFMIKFNLDEREAENKIRERLGIPKIGEGWVNETLLFNTVRFLYPKYEVQREASPQWLDRQRFDIFMPEVGVAIEYQGEQHFNAVDLFGGDEGLKRSQERDREKRKKARKAGVVVVEFRYDEALTEQKISQKIDRAIASQDRAAVQADGA